MRRAPFVVGLTLVLAILIYRNSLPRHTSVVLKYSGSLVDSDHASPGADPRASQYLVSNDAASESGSSRQQPRMNPRAARAKLQISDSQVVPPREHFAPPPPPPQPVCTELSCTKKLRSLEPPWVNLAFQPRIDWSAGGLRGDCVVGEIEYISRFYCDPPGTQPTFRGKFPSEDRLDAADVYSAPLPKASLTDVARMLPNQTLLIVGDSVMEQFYNSVQCFLRKESLEGPPDPGFLGFIKSNEYLWKMGKRKMPPKLPQKATTGTRLLFSRQVNYQPEDVAATLATGNVIVVNVSGQPPHASCSRARALPAARLALLDPRRR